MAKKPFLAIPWQKVAINGHDNNENGSEYLKPLYFHIVEVVQLFSQGFGHESDYGQIAKNGKTKLNLKIKKMLSNFGFKLM